MLETRKSIRVQVTDGDLDWNLEKALQLVTMSCVGEGRPITNVTAFFVWLIKLEKGIFEWDMVHFDV